MTPLEYILLSFFIVFLLTILCCTGLLIYMIKQRNKYIDRKEHDQRFNTGDRKGVKW